MDAKKRRRALVALAMLMATGLSTFEPVVGEVRDVAEHYGDVIAAAHTTSAVDAGAVEFDAQDDAQHIEGFDHCAHAHGAAVRGVLSPERSVVVIPTRAQPTLTTRHPDVTPSQPYHPPKA